MLSEKELGQYYYEQQNEKRSWSNIQRYHLFFKLTQLASLQVSDLPSFFVWVLLYIHKDRKAY